MAEMSPLRRRMTEDMTVRNLSPAKQGVISDQRGLHRHVRSTPRQRTVSRRNKNVERILRSPTGCSPFA
jgi:hypothetical protein